MQVAICLIAILGSSVALPAKNFPWNEIKGTNLLVKPVSDYSTVDAANSGRIIGGNEVSPHSLPFHVGLIIHFQSFCSGTLISPNFVLTAAHCIVRASHVELIFGAHNVNIEESTQLRVASVNIICHPDYRKPDLNSNDIALIKTPSHIVTNNYIQIVTLAPADAGSYEGFVVALSGWGTTSDSSTGITSGLREAYITVMENYLCALFWPSYNYSTNICTSGIGAVGGCNGDNGAPLMSVRHQIGIVSMISSDACEMGWPTGYTRISHYRSWIDQQISL
ncbi:hypothetical protein NQ315_011576 [Exocentrus adspersus]|uniref:Peptidase S1 domain-containing protein n=1 Tax=Exocentrus adspersus TaxID=1586481 RepID=A0AAV8VVR9_9CUCU|nr:hypothetical protein NQ315_011576 [Exocentrus adspersus]